MFPHAQLDASAKGVIRMSAVVARLRARKFWSAAGRLRAFVILQVCITLFSPVWAEDVAGELTASRSDGATGEGTIPAPRLIKHPSKPIDLISNLLYIAQHDLVFRPDFYSDKNLRRLLGATHIQGERTSTSVSLAVQLASAPSSVSLGGVVDMPGAGALLRRSSDGTASIQIQINDPTARPAYSGVERVLGSDWRPFISNTPTPHRRYVAPRSPHGNADMSLQVRSPLADNLIGADFDPDARLHHFNLFIRPLAKGK